MTDMRSFIANSATTLEVIRSADKTYMFSVNESSHSNRYAVNWLIGMQKKKGYDIHREDSIIQESTCSHPENNIDVKGRKLNPDFLRCYYVAKQVVKYARASDLVIKRVVEIGAGTGHVARMLNLLLDIDQYVVIDIPETLAFSFSFFTENFPLEKIHLYNPETSTLDDISSAKFILVPAPYAIIFPIIDYDLFINTASLGEMRVESVRLWMDLIQSKFNVRLLYTLNRYLNSIKLPDHVWRLSENESSVLYDERWNILSWQLEPEFTRRPYVDTQIARYVEIIALRLDRIDADYDLDAERCEIEAQDWFRFMAKDNTMTLLDTQTSHDYSMSGTLFRLWNAIRLTKSMVCWPIEYLLLYLNYINKSDIKLYEEFFYYLAIYEARFLGRTIDKPRYEKVIVGGMLRSKSQVTESQGVISVSPLHGFKVWLIRKIGGQASTEKSAPPVLVADCGGSNCVYFDGYFYMIDKSLGDISLEEASSNKLKELPRSLSFKFQG